MKAKNKKKGNTAIAALVMALLIVLSVPLGVNRSFDRLREEVEDEYHYDSTGYALWEGMDAREECAQNLLKVAGNYVDQYPELDPLIDDLEYRVKLSQNTSEHSDETLSSIVKVNDELTRDAQALYEQLEQLELSERDEKYPRQIMAEMDAEQDKMERSSYNDKAREYNGRLEKFPVNFLRHISGLKEMGVFEKQS